ncbi:hypothetical protein FHS49_000895 [Sphingobium boeckii]|uniref:Uncharacterized protein n=1 Tax=Sphingobium boeckii TaxID=1082345 RepID=A0A7W9EDG5_9SPHN|nr:hypothetical protein [Sphingobium boeckii]
MAKCCPNLMLTGRAAGRLKRPSSTGGSKFKARGVISEGAQRAKRKNEFKAAGKADLPPLGQENWR